MGFSGSGNGPEINVTPLIDVLLVLIIVFMVIVSMSNQKGLDAQIPQPANSHSQVPPPERTIVVQLDGTQEPPTVKINQQNATWDGLRPKLADIFATRMEKVAFVQAHKEVAFEYVAQVIDIAHEVGIMHVGLITTEPQEIAMVQAHRR